MGESLPAVCSGRCQPGTETGRVPQSRSPCRAGCSRMEGRVGQGRDRGERGAGPALPLEGCSHVGTPPPTFQSLENSDAEASGWSPRGGVGRARRRSPSSPRSRCAPHRTPPQPGSPTGLGGTRRRKGRQPEGGSRRAWGAGRRALSGAARIPPPRPGRAPTRRVPLRGGRRPLAPTNRRRRRLRLPASPLALGL